MRKLFHGFFDADINLLLEHNPSFVSSFDCLVTCIDSGVDTAKMVAFALPDLTFDRLGPFAVIRGQDVLSIRRGLFFGFDEFYAFEPAAWRGLDESLWPRHFTSEVLQLKDAIRPDIRDIFVKSGAKTYASDGLGLNVITDDETMLEALGRRFGDAGLPFK